MKKYLMTMNNIALDHVKAYLNQYRIKNCKIIISVSGGIDSMVLCDILLKLKKNFNLELAVLHFNHALRKESDEEASFVENYCEQNDLNYYYKSLAVKDLMKSEKLSLEMAAHQLRYEQYDYYIEKYQADYIATAHHKDDLVETILMKLGKSAGRENIQGLAPFRKSFIKPLYKVLKQQIVDYQQKEKIEFVTDISNDDISIERNFWRKEILPLLKNYYSEGYATGLINTLSNLNWTSEDYNLLKKELEATEYSKNSIVLELEKLKSYFSEFLKRYLEELMSKLTDEKITLNTNQFNTIIHLFESETGKKLQINELLEISKQFDKIHLKLIFEKSILNADLIPGTTQKLNNASISAEFVDQFVQSDKSNIEFIDFDKVKSSMHIRYVRPGDVFAPIGLNGNQKINRFLKSLKIPSNERSDKMLLCDDKNIIWLIGHRLDEKYKVTKETKTILKLEFFNAARN